MSRMAKLGKVVAKSLFKEAKPVTKGGDPKSLGNLYTGKRINPLWAGGAAAVALGSKMTTGSLSSSAITPLQLATQRDMQHYGEADGLSYDGVSNQPKNPSNLNADGSLVFGLHNMRRGG